MNIKKNRPAINLTTENVVVENAVVENSSASTQENVVDNKDNSSATQN